MDKDRGLLNSTQNLSDLMRNVVVYVEVRTGEDNRSDGIKKVISQLGAKVNDRLLKTTTHVIFKDGLLSTYKKAKQWNLPLVSILWIEACKKNGCLMDPLLYPISNCDRYDYPEMYDKIKRIKSMQPDAEESKRRPKLKNGNKVDSPQVRTVTLPRVPRTPKDNLNNILYEFQEKIMSTPDNNDDSMIFQSKLLQRIQNSPFTPTNKKPTKRKSSSINVTQIDLNLSKVEDNNKFQKIANSTARESSRLRRPSSRFPSEMFDMSKISVPKKTDRRKTITSMTSTGMKSISSYFTPPRDEFKTPVAAKPNINNNKTILQDFNITESNDVETTPNQPNCNEMNLEDCTIFTPVSRPNQNLHKRTLYTPKDMEISDNTMCGTFSSAKKPINNRRKTLFDLRLDIIDQSLQQINELTKLNKSISSEIIPKESDKITVETISDNSSVPSQNDQPVIKKRKLFVPDQFEMSPNIEFEKTLTTGSARKSRVSLNPTKVKDMRRRTIHPLVFSYNKENRRSSFDFDSLDKPKIIIQPIKKQVTKPVIVFTNMHKEQIEFIQRAVKTLGKFDIANVVTDKTTHLVSLECRRTINLIKGIIRGLWILKYDWVVDSFNHGKWLHEESYELREFARSVEICRSERQAFGSGYKMEIFADLPAIYISKKCKVPIENLKDVIILCSGNLVDDPKYSKYVIGDYYNGKICLQPQWILDSITNNKLQKFFKYKISN